MNFFPSIKTTWPTSSDAMLTMILTMGLQSSINVRFKNIRLYLDGYYYHLLVKSILDSKTFNQGFLCSMNFTLNILLERIHKIDNKLLFCNNYGSRKAIFFVVAIMLVIIFLINVRTRLYFRDLDGAFRSIFMCDF